MKYLLPSILLLFSQLGEAQVSYRVFVSIESVTCNKPTEELDRNDGIGDELVFMMAGFGFDSQANLLKTHLQSSQIYGDPIGHLNRIAAGTANYDLHTTLGGFRNGDQALVQLQMGYYDIGPNDFYCLVPSIWEYDSTPCPIQFTSTSYYLDPYRKPLLDFVQGQYRVLTYSQKAKLLDLIQSKTAQAYSVDPVFNWPATLTQNGHPAIIPTVRDQCDCATRPIGVLNDPLQGNFPDFKQFAVSLNYTALKALFESQSKDRVTSFVNITYDEVNDPYSIPTLADKASYTLKLRLELFKITPTSNTTITPVIGGNKGSIVAPSTKLVTPVPSTKIPSPNYSYVGNWNTVLKNTKQLSAIPENYQVFLTDKFELVIKDQTNAIKGTGSYTTTVNGISGSFSFLGKLATYSFTTVFDAASNSLNGNFKIGNSIVNDGTIYLKKK